MQLQNQLFQPLFPVPRIIYQFTHDRMFYVIFFFFFIITPGWPVRAGEP